MSGLEDGWPAAISAWANRQEDIQALVQFGSRARQDGSTDTWSDYDYHLITSDPQKYRDGSFARELGPCWASASQFSFGDVDRVTAVYDGALEADFIILGHVDMVIVALALSWPASEPLWPRPLARGVRSLRIAAGPGWKVIKGGALWEKRYSRISPLRDLMGEEEFRGLCAKFWVELVWAAKKAARGEWRASQRAVHEHLVECGLRVFREEALLDGRQAHYVGRRAEAWLTKGQLEATGAGTRPERAALMSALVQLSGEFAASCARVASRNMWKPRDYPEIRSWLAGLSDSSSAGPGAAGPAGPGPG
jgi:hypothetical protein